MTKKLFANILSMLILGAIYALQSMLIIVGIASTVVYALTPQHSRCMIENVEDNLCMIGLNEYNLGVGISYLAIGVAGLCMCILYSRLQNKNIKGTVYVLGVLSMCLLLVWGPITGGYVILTPTRFTRYWDEFYHSAYVMAMFSAISGTILLGVLLFMSCIFCFMTDLNDVQ